MYFSAKQVRKWFALSV